MNSQKQEPILHVKYEVVAYDESGYGADRSREFWSREDAIRYAQSLEPRFGAQVFKRITMVPISQKIWDHTQK